MRKVLKEIAVLSVLIVGLSCGCIEEKEMTVDYPVTFALQGYPGTYVMQEDGTFTVTIMGLSSTGSYVVTDCTTNSITYDVTIGKENESATLVLYDDNTVKFSAEGKEVQGTWRVGVE